VLHVRDLQVPRGIRVLVAPDEVVASVSVRGEEEVAAGAPSAAGTEAAAPETESEEP